MAANLSNAVDKSGEFPVFDYSKMILSKGSFAAGRSTGITIAQDGIQVNYQPLSENGEPSWWCGDSNTENCGRQGVVGEKPRGQSEEDSIFVQLSNASAERIMYMYMMVVSADKTKASKSVCKHCVRLLTS